MKKIFGILLMLPIIVIVIGVLLSPLYFDYQEHNYRFSIFVYGFFGCALAYEIGKKLIDD